jgi:hypothetical protein
MLKPLTNVGITADFALILLILVKRWPKEFLVSHGVTWFCHEMTRLFCQFPV